MGGQKLLNVEPKEIAKSALHFLGGKLIRYEEVPADDEHSTRGSSPANLVPKIASLMRTGRLSAVATTQTWRSTGPPKTPSTSGT
jgi:hypothetical protein